MEVKAQSTEASDWLDSETIMIKRILLYNVGNILDIQRRLIFSKALLITSQFGMVCLTVTWLTNDFPDSCLFFGDNPIHRQDRATKSSSDINPCGFFVAVKPEISHERLELAILIEDAIVPKILSGCESFALCCLFSSPKPSIYRHNPDQLIY